MPFRPHIHHRRGRASLVIAAAIPLAIAGPSCVSLFPSPITPDTGKAAEGPRSDFLAITPIRWSRGADTLVSLSAEGVVRDRGVVLGTLRADGTFTTRDGKRSLVMDPDGTAHVGPGFDVVIAADGAATTRVHGQPDETVTLDQVGKPRGGNPALVPEGVTPASRRTAMWILMIPDLLRILSSAEGG